MKASIGTPKTLDQAVANMVCIRRPEMAIEEYCYHTMKDFMAQKFGVAYFQMGAWRDGSSTQYTPEEILENLFEALTRREK